MWFPGTCEEMGGSCSDLWKAIKVGPDINAVLTVNTEFSQLEDWKPERLHGPAGIKSHTEMLL